MYTFNYFIYKLIQFAPYRNKFIFLDESSIVKNRCLFEVLKNNSFTLTSSTYESRNAMIAFITHRLGEKSNLEGNEEFDKCIQNKVEGFSSTLKKKWLDSNRCLTKFKKKNDNWLDLEFKIPLLKKREEFYEPSTSSGRPRKSFLESSDRSKRRQIKNLREITSSDELICAAKSTLYVEGKRAAADLVSQVTECSPQRAIKIRKLYKNEAKNKYTSYTDDEAVAFIIDTHMTKNAYHKTNLI